MQPMSLWSAEAIFSQQGQVVLAFAGVEFCSGAGAGVVDCAQDIIVRAKINEMSLCFMEKISV